MRESGAWSSRLTCWGARCSMRLQRCVPLPVHLLRRAQAVLKPLNRFRLLKAGRMCMAQVLMAEDAQPSHAADKAAQLAGVAARATAAETPQV